MPPTQQRTPSEAKQIAVSTLRDINAALGDMMRRLGGVPPDLAEAIVGAVAAEMISAAQQLEHNFSGALAQGRNAIEQAPGPQSLSQPLAQRPQSEQSIQSQPEEQSAAAELLAKLGGQFHGQTH
jgi:hypothetical protein